MRATLVSLAAAAAVLAGCGYVSDYEAGVYDEEPVYCYQSLGGVSCFDEPHHRDQRRMVNYYGPSPQRYTPPDPPPAARLDPPPAVNYFVRDAEPVPRPRPHGNVGDRPWLMPAPEAETRVGAEPPDAGSGVTVEDQAAPAEDPPAPVDEPLAFIEGT